MIDKIEVTVFLSKDVNEAANKKATRILFWETIVGALGLLLYIVIATVYDIMYGYEPSFCNFILLPSAVLFGMGLAFLLATKKASKRFQEAENSYVFEADGFTVNTSRDGETVGFSKHRYSEVQKVTQTKELLLLRVPKGYYPIEKARLTESELDTLLAWMKQAKKQA